MSDDIQRRFYHCFNCILVYDQLILYSFIMLYDLVTVRKQSNDGGCQLVFKAHFPQSGKFLSSIHPYLNYWIEFSAALVKILFNFVSKISFSYKLARTHQKQREGQFIFFHSLVTLRSKMSKNFDYQTVEQIYLNEGNLNKRCSAIDLCSKWLQSLTFHKSSVAFFWSLKIFFYPVRSLLVLQDCKINISKYIVISTIINT